MVRTNGGNPKSRDSAVGLWPGEPSLICLDFQSKVFYIFRRAWVNSLSQVIQQ